MSRPKEIALLLMTLCMGIVLVSVIYTGRIARALQQEEEQNIAVWAEATRQLIQADENADIDFITSVIEANTTIPVYMVDSCGTILLSRNVTHPVSNPQSLNGPIELHISDDNIQYIYWDQSLWLSRLRYLPYIEFLLILVFIGIAVALMVTTLQSEQNRLWVGLSKETAHQLGTPISSLNAWQTLLQDRYPEDDLIPLMQKDIARLETIAGRFSKVGSLPTLKQEDMVQVTQDAVEYMRTRTSHRIRIQTDFPNTVCPVMLSAPLYAWVIENLIKNAVDAITQDGSITLRLTQNETHYQLDISDTGKGMDKKTARRIFRAGFTTKQRGWGLGLSLSKRIIEEYHRGELLLESSQRGVGTTFRILLKKTKDR